MQCLSAIKRTYWFLAIERRLGLSLTIVVVVVAVGRQILAPDTRTKLKSLSLQFSP